MQEENTRRSSGSHIGGELTKVVQSGTRALSPNQFSNIAISRSFKAWSREVQDYARMADRHPLVLLGEAERATENIAISALDWQGLGQELHYFISSSLDGDALMLSLNTEFYNLGKDYNEGYELWRLLVFIYEKKSAYNVASDIVSWHNTR